MKLLLPAILCSFLMVSTATRPSHGAESAPGPGDATEVTRKANTAILQQLPFSDREDFEFAQRGLIATAPAIVAARRPGGPLAWDSPGSHSLRRTRRPRRP